MSVLRRDFLRGAISVGAMEACIDMAARLGIATMRIDTGRWNTIRYLAGVPGSLELLREHFS
jgi:hypothetical protein